MFSEKTVVVTTSGQSSVGGLGGFDVKALGATGTGKGKVGAFTGTGISARGGSGGGWGFAGRTSSGSKKAMLGSSGGTRQSERAVAAALNWLARHQLPNGSWSLSAYKSRCKDGSCTGPSARGDRFAAATALALLPLLGGRADARVERTVSAKHLCRHFLFDQESEAQRRLADGRQRCTIKAWRRLRCASATG